MNLIPCLGGWCQSRGNCQHYLNPSKDLEPVERLCGKVEEPEKVKEEKHG